MSGGNGPFTIHDQIVLITGAGRGSGRVLALTCAAVGFIAGQTLLVDGGFSLP